MTLTHIHNGICTCIMLDNWLMQHCDIILLSYFHIEGDKSTEAVAVDLFTNC